MPELEPQAQATDPIGSLHRMSTTAGLTTQEYVAINSFAVAAFVLGWATALAFLAMPFLILGVAAIACGWLALHQIRASAGTQSGAWLAWLGMGLAIVLAGMVLADQAQRKRAEQAEARQIEAAILQMGQLLMQGRYAEAYASCDPAFTSKYSADLFEQVWRRQQDPERGGGPLRQMEGNRIVRLISSGDTLIAYTQAVVRFEKSTEPGRLSLQLIKGPDGTWRISRMIELFDPTLLPSRRSR